MKERIGNQGVRRGDTVLFAAVHGGRRRPVLRRIKLSLGLNGAFYALVFVHPERFDPGHEILGSSGNRSRNYRPPPGFAPTRDAVLPATFAGGGFCAAAFAGAFFCEAPVRATP